MYRSGETAPDALCVLYNKVLPDSPTLPAKLRRHHDNNHPHFKDKDISFFQAYM